MNFNFDITNLITQYLPSYKRKIVRINWLVVLASYFKQIHTEFLSHFTTVKNEMKWDGRTILLERVLQDRFQIPSLTITNNDLTINPLLGYPCPNTDNVISYAPNDPQSPIAYGPDITLESYGFTIRVPIGSTYDESELRAVVKRYQIGSSNFNIIEI